jgi:hypothetical protein
LTEDTEVVALDMKLKQMKLEEEETKESSDQST